MSALNDYLYLRSKSMDLVNADVDKINFEGMSFFPLPAPNRLFEALKKSAGFCRSICKALWKLFEEDPSYHNERVQRHHYDCPPIRGIY